MVVNLNFSCLLSPSFWCCFPWKRHVLLCHVTQCLPLRTIRHHNGCILTILANQRDMSMCRTFQHVSLVEDLEWLGLTCMFLTKTALAPEQKTNCRTSSEQALFFVQSLDAVLCIVERCLNRLWCYGIIISFPKVLTTEKCTMGIPTLGGTIFCLFSASGLKKTNWDIPLLVTSQNLSGQIWMGNGQRRFGSHKHFEHPRIPQRQGQESKLKKTSFRLKSWGKLRNCTHRPAATKP